MSAEPPIHKKAVSMPNGSPFKVLAALLLALSASLISSRPASAQPAAMIERVWYEGQSGRRVWMAPDEMAIVFDAIVVDAIVFDAKGPSRREAQTRFERTAPQAKLMRQD
ncbi:MAG: hypothetical protein HYZ58_16030, partial [Acidobacteria bacterium]|nr:hypothetical protein [Acidobacteriota bacterium]